jgi:hypothetical protein
VTSRYNAAVAPMYLSRREAAEHFGVTVKTIERWEAAGLLEARRIGPRVIRITWASIVALDEAGA